jgi:hypothetical protein
MIPRVNDQIKKIRHAFSGLFLIKGWIIPRGVAGPFGSRTNCFLKNLRDVNLFRV